MARTTIEIDEFLTDPLKALQRARQTSWVAEFGLGAGVVKYQEARELLSDPRLRANFADFLKTFGITSGAFFDWMAISPLNHDGVEHQRWRSVMSKTFTPRRVDLIRPFLRSSAHKT